jgi:DNA-binding NtrC family response regulator
MLVLCQKQFVLLIGFTRIQIDANFVCYAELGNRMYIICMTQAKNLSGRDRDFLRLLAEAAATNPFSDAYFELVLKIAGCDASTPAEEQYKRIVSRVSEEVRKLEESGSDDMRQYGGEDRQLVRYALMFDIYHRFMPQLDQLIAEQIKAGERSVPARFAADILRLLAHRGFSSEEARQYFAILFQLRRAFFFIDRGLVGNSESMKALRRHLWNNVFTHDIRLYERYLWNRMEDFSTMLLGETGTGKGTAAAAIGRSGFIPYDEKKGAFADSFTGSFTALNLSQFSETLIESELFGHRKGAFTGAVEAHLGIFARCSEYGAIFLDEIGDASIPIQIKLLDILQERTFSPVGSHEKLRFRGRIIAATNKPLNELRTGGQFREDFFYRLCSDIIEVPSLRQRLHEEPTELKDLIELIVRRLTGESSGEIVDTVHSAILESPGKDYQWPGNVRELEQAVRRVLLTRQYSGDHRAVSPDLRARLQAGIAEGSLRADSLLAGYCRLMYDRLGTYEEVARRLGLDRRTVKAYVQKSGKTD